MKRMSGIAMGMALVLVVGCKNSNNPTVSSNYDGGTGGDGGGTGTDLVAETEQDVVGAWQDQNPCEPLPTGPSSTSYLKLGFQFDGTRWTNTLAAFADPLCSEPLFVAVIGGPYTFGQVSATVTDAVETTFGIDTITLTPQNDMMAAAFSQQMCGGNAAWMTGVSGDVSTTGCLFVPSVSACPAEYDLVAVDTTSLHFGQRPSMGDICAPERRPTALAVSTFVHADVK